MVWFTWCQQLHNTTWMCHNLVDPLLWGEEWGEEAGGEEWGEEGGGGSSTCMYSSGIPESSGQIISWGDQTGSSRIGQTGNWVEKWASWELDMAVGQLEGVCVTLWKWVFRQPALHSQYHIQKKVVLKVFNQTFHKATHRGTHLYDKITTWKCLPHPRPELVEHVTVSM